MHCTYQLPIVGVVSAGVPVSSCVEVRQSGHGAMAVVFLYPGEGSLATGDKDGVLKLYGTCVPVIIIIITCCPYYNVKLR